MNTKMFRILCKTHRSYAVFMVPEMLQRQNQKVYIFAYFIYVYECNFLYSVTPWYVKENKHFGFNRPFFMITK